MKNLHEILFNGKRIRVMYDENERIQKICLDDVCTVLRRNSMIETGEAMRICTTAVQPEVDKRLRKMWLVNPSDITALCRVVRKENSMAAKVCDQLMAWMGKLPIGQEAPPVTEENSLDAVEITRNKLELKYQDHVISFKLINGGLYVNATQLARVYDTLPSTWIRRIETIRYRDELVEKRAFSNLESQVVTTRGAQGATWIEERLGVELSRWLSPELHAWYMETLKNLLPNKYGSPRRVKKAPESKPKEHAIPNNLKDAQAMILQLLKESEGNEHKILFYDDYVENRENFKSMRIAEELDISTYKMHQFLFDQGICSYEKRQWVVKTQHQALQAEIPYLWTNSQGKTYAFGKVRRWTHAGREYILELYRNEQMNNDQQ